MKKQKGSSKLFYPQDEKNRPSNKKIILYSIAIFVILVLVGYLSEHFS